MITALCLNPSLDRTVYVERLEIGGTNRVLREQTVPGGKGVNIARMMACFSLSSSESAPCPCPWPCPCPCP